MGPLPPTRRAGPAWGSLRCRRGAFTPGMSAPRSSGTGGAPYNFCGHDTVRPSAAPIRPRRPPAALAATATAPRLSWLTLLLRYARCCLSRRKRSSGSSGVRRRPNFASAIVTRCTRRWRKTDSRRKWSGWRSSRRELPRSSKGVWRFRLSSRHSRHWCSSARQIEAQISCIRVR